jgi:hypothetical protein
MATLAAPPQLRLYFESHDFRGPPFSRVDRDGASASLQRAQPQPAGSLSPSERVSRHGGFRCNRVGRGYPSAWQRERNHVARCLNGCWVDTSIDRSAEDWAT